MKLETKRLILRPPRLKDADDLVKGIGELQVSRYLAFVPFPYKKKDAILWINKQIKNWKKEKKEDLNFMIVLKSENRMIGSTGLHSIDYFNSKVRTGSWIARKYWRKGYVSEAKVAINDFIFDKLKLQKIETDAFVKNKASNYMMKKLGFKFEGKLKKHIRAKSTGKWHDVNVYGMFKEDWRKAREKLG